VRLARSDFFLGLGAIALSAGYLYAATGIQESLLSDSVGAAGVPRALGWIMGALGLLLCLRSVSFARAPAAAASSADRPDPPADHRSGMHPHLQALCLLGILVGYILLAPYLGYLVTIGLLVAAVARFGGAPFNRNLLLISAASGIGLWAVFAWILGISMTAGSLFAGA
jgi:putative tricarboxylic transport membrane protein